MSAFSGPQAAGARRTLRTVRRVDAEARNAATPLEKTAKFRRDRAVVQAAVRDARGGEPNAHTRLVDEIAGT